MVKVTKVPERKGPLKVLEDHGHFSGSTSIVREGFEWAGRSSSEMRNDWLGKQSVTSVGLGGPRAGLSSAKTGRVPQERPKDCSCRSVMDL